MKKVMIHLTIVGLVSFAADLMLNEGRASQALVRDLDSDRIVASSKRKADRANAYIRSSASM